MKLEFYKYQGTGNDFILIDNRKNIIHNPTTELIKRLCTRQFGIGADGLMLLQEKSGYDFEMIYYNSDGNTSTMCGNGGRCIVAFAYFLGIIKNNKCNFLAIDGEHSADIIIVSNNNTDIDISLKMTDVAAIQDFNSYVLLNTGSPHHVSFHTNISSINIKKEGRQIRFDQNISKDGVNANFVQVLNNFIKVRTYERGVEDETLSCGTGVTAAVLATHYRSLINNNNITVKTLGGELNVRFENIEKGKYSNIWLKGNTQQVFSGHISI